MTEYNTSRTLDEVPEADLAEQSVPAYPEEPDEIIEGTDPAIAAVVDRNEWSADPADVVEQSIEVPLDDDRDTGVVD